MIGRDVDHAIQRMIRRDVDLAPARVAWLASRPVGTQLAAPDLVDARHAKETSLLRQLVVEVVGEGRARHEPRVVRLELVQRAELSIEAAATRDGEEVRLVEHNAVEVHVGDERGGEEHVRRRQNDVGRAKVLLRLVVVFARAVVRVDLGVRRKLEDVFLPLPVQQSESRGCQLEGETERCTVRQSSWLQRLGSSSLGAYTARACC